MSEKIVKLLESGESEVIVKKSRFIGITYPVNTPEEAADFVNSIKKKYYDARHNCYAYVIGDKREQIKFSDDGEPGGTAGKPMLDVLLGSGITNIVVVVTRYFGVRHYPTNSPRFSIRAFPLVISVTLFSISSARSTGIPTFIRILSEYSVSYVTLSFDLNNLSRL